MGNSTHNPFATTLSNTVLDANAVEPTTLVSATPLAHALADSTSLSLQPYRGVLTAEIFSNPAEELAATLTAAGVYDLGWRSSLQCSGKDRVRWLNGMVTNSVNGLEENAGCYAFVLNSQGRIQGDLDIFRRAEDLWLETDSAQVEMLLGYLKHYIIMDKVVLEQQPSWTSIGIAGPMAAATMAAAGLPAAPSPQHLVETTWQNHAAIVVTAHSPLIPQYEIWIERDRALDAWNTLTTAGAKPCGSIAVEQLRILGGIPAYSIDISNKDLPQETNQMRALHFTKGCYLGQEIVERIRSRGNVHRTLSGFILEDAKPRVKTPLVADEMPVGEITSIARISLPGVGEQVLALGTIRREVLERSAAVMADTTVAMPSPLPFDVTGKAVRP